MFSAEFDALLEMARLPCTAAADAGLNVIEIVTEPFGISVTLFPPLALNPAPFAETLEIVTFVVPESVRTTVCVTGVPTVTLPNVRAVELAASVDCTSVAGLLAATAVAEIGI